MTISRQVSSLSEIVNIFIYDLAVSTYAGLANAVASSVQFGWQRNNQALASSGTCSSGGTLGTYSVSSLTQMSSTLMRGWYQFGIPNSALDSGSAVVINFYGAPNMRQTPMEIELTKFNNQAYVSSVNVLGSVNPHGVSSITARVGVSTLVGVSTITIPVGVSSGTVSVSTLVGVSTLTIPVGVSSGTWLAGVSTITDKGGYGVSSAVGISSMTLPVGVSSQVGVSSFAIAVGVSSNADKTSYTLDSTYGPARSISTNIVKIAGVNVSGLGTSAAPWGP